MSQRSLDQFFLGCESPRPLRLVATRCQGDRPVGPPTPFAFDAPFAVVGRHPDVDVVLNDPALSPRHCYLQALGSGVLCVDLGSGSGVHLDGGPARAAWLRPGRAVRVGNHWLAVDDGHGRPGALVGGGNGPGAEDDDPVITRPVPKIQLDFQADRFQTNWPMRRAIALVGSAYGCGVRLNSASVAPFHAALVRTATGLWVVDLLPWLDDPSVPGVLVNGRPVRFGRVGPDDRLKLGDFSVRADYRGPGVGTAPLSAVPAARTTLGQVTTLQSRPLPGLPSEPKSLESRLAAVVERQCAEIESLRRELEELRELTEELRSQVRRKGRNERPRELPDKRQGPSADRPRRRSVRVLGAAARRPGGTARATSEESRPLAPPVGTFPGLSENHPVDLRHPGLDPVVRTPGATVG